MKELLCIDNHGMEDYLSIGEVYKGFIDPITGSKLLQIQESDNGCPCRALPSRFRVLDNTKPSVKVKKPKQKPLTRKKSDITVTYTNGKSYTLKDIFAVYVQGSVFQVTRKTVGAPGVSASETFNLANVKSAVIKTPTEWVSIDNMDGDTLVTTRHHAFNAGYYFWEA